MHAHPTDSTKLEVLELGSQDSLYVPGIYCKDMRPAEILDCKSGGISLLLVTDDLDALFG
jgi:hypothetical protein